MELKLNETYLYARLGEVPINVRVDLLETIGLSDLHFLDSPEARGVITSAIFERLSTEEWSQEHIELKQLLVHWAMDSWLSAIYITIWRPRNKVTVLPFEVRRRKEEQKKKRLARNKEKALKRAAKKRKPTSRPEP